MIFSLAEFFGGLGVVSIMMDLSDRRVMHQSGEGPITPVGVGQRVWSGQVSIRPYYHVEAREIHAKIQALKEPDALFFVSPSDAQEAGQAGTVATIEADRRLITLTGVTPAIGDYLGVNNGTVYGLHKVVRLFTDDAGATIPQITVVPALPLAIAPGDVATTDSPQIKARIDAGSTGPTFTAVFGGDIGFGFRQVIT